MRSIFAVSSILISIIGLIFIVRGCVHPNKYKATHFVVIGIGIISFSILIAVISLMFNWNDMTDRFLNLFRKSQKTTEADDTVHNLTKEENDS